MLDLETTPFASLAALETTTIFESSRNTNESWRSHDDVTTRTERDRATPTNDGAASQLTQPARTAKQ